MHGDTILEIQWGIQYSLVNIVWDTASTGSYGSTVFPGGIPYSRLFWRGLNLANWYKNVIGEFKFGECMFHARKY